MTAKRNVLAVLAAAHVAIVASVAPLAWAADDDPIAATVNGHEIRLSEVEQAKALLPPQLQAQPLAVVYDILLDSLINSRLAADMARKDGLHEQDEYKERMARIGDQVLERMLLTTYIEERVTEEALAERYAQVKAELAGQKEVHARHILVETEQGAQDLIAQLDDGADFAQLAREHSTGPSGPQGGDLGWFGPGQMVPAFEDAAMAMDAGQHSAKPVKTRFGWHVIKVEETRPIEVPEFAQMRPALVNELSAELGQKLMTDLREAAKIETKSWQDLSPAAATE